MAQSDSSEIREVIAAANEEFMAALSRGDAAGIAALYTETAQILPPNSDILSGRQAIQTFWQGVIDMGVRAARLETVEVEARGDIAHEVGRFALHGAGAQMIDTGKYVVIWQWDAVKWKLHRDIWNSSQPAPRQ